MPPSAGGHAQRDNGHPGKPGPGRQRDPLDEPLHDPLSQRSRRRSAVQFGVLVLGLLLVGAGFLAVWDPRSPAGLAVLPWRVGSLPLQPLRGRIGMRGSSSLRQLGHRANAPRHVSLDVIEQKVAGLCREHRALPAGRPAELGMLGQCLPQLSPAARAPSPQWGEEKNVGGDRSVAALNNFIASLGLPKVALLFLVRCSSPTAILPCSC